jgi:hypothetical protein
MIKIIKILMVLFLILSAISYSKAGILSGPSNPTPGDLMAFGSSKTVTDTTLQSSNLLLISVTNINSQVHGIATADTTGTNVFISCTNINQGRVIYWDYQTANNTTVYPTNCNFTGAQFKLEIIASGSITVSFPTNWTYINVTNGLTIVGPLYTISLNSGEFMTIDWTTNNYNEFASWQKYYP